MSFVERIPRFIWRLMRLPPQLAYALGFGSIIGRVVLLLKTAGRKTGRLRVTPLQYEKVGDRYYVAAARGMKTDWLRNILADPNVEIRVGAQCLQARAEVIRDPGLIADFLALRLRNRPRFVGMIMRIEGFPSQPEREDLEAYAARRVMVVLEPK